MIIFLKKVYFRGVTQNIALCTTLYGVVVYLRDRCWFCCSVLTATVINRRTLLLLLLPWLSRGRRPFDDWTSRTRYTPVACSPYTRDRCRRRICSWSTGDTAADQPVSASVAPSSSSSSSSSFSSSGSCGSCLHCYCCCCCCCCCSSSSSSSSCVVVVVVVVDILVAVHLVLVLVIVADAALVLFFIFVFMFFICSRLSPFSLVSVFFPSCTLFIIVVIIIMCWRHRSACFTGPLSTSCCLTRSSNDSTSRCSLLHH